MNTPRFNEQTPGNPSPGKDPIDVSLAWDMAHAAQPFREAAHVLDKAGISGNDAARLVTKANLAAERIEQEHNKSLGIKTTSSLLEKHTLDPVNVIVDGPIPDDLLVYPTEDYKRSRWNSGGKIHNLELAEELAYTQAPYEDARKELFDTTSKDYSEWSAKEHSDARKKQKLAENGRIAVRNAELDYYNRRGTSLGAVTAATKALFLDKFWALDEQRKAAVGAETAQSIEQEIRELSAFTPPASTEYYTKRHAYEQKQRDDARKAFNQEILASKENFLQLAKESLLVPGKKGELPTLKLPIGLTNRIWQKFMEHHNEDENISLASSKEQEAVVERLGIYWNQIGYKYVTKDELGYTPLNSEKDAEDKLYEKSIYAIAINKPGFVSRMGFKSFEAHRAMYNDPEMHQSSQNAKLGAAKLLTIIDTILAEPRNEAEDSFNPQTDPNLRTYYNSTI